jgi:hypothetical protein
MEESGQSEEEQNNVVSFSGYGDEHGHPGNRHTGNTFHVGRWDLGGCPRSCIGCLARFGRTGNYRAGKDRSLIGLVGVGILAWAIAAAGDSLARAYALAHVTRTPSDQNNQPAIQTAANKLAEVYAAAHGITITDTKITPAPQGQITPSLTSQKVKVRGKDAQVMAILVSGESGKETQRYLVALPGSQPVWVSHDAISIPDAAPPTPGGTPPLAPPGATITTS